MLPLTPRCCDDRVLEAVARCGLNPDWAGAGLNVTPMCLGACKGGAIAASNARLVGSWNTSMFLARALYWQNGYDGVPGWQQGECGWRKARTCAVGGDGGRKLKPDYGIINTE